EEEQIAGTASCLRHVIFKSTAVPDEAFLSLLGHVSFFCTRLYEFLEFFVAFRVISCSGKTGKVFKAIILRGPLLSDRVCSLEFTNGLLGMHNRQDKRIELVRLH